MRRWSLSAVTGVAWTLVALAVLLLPGIGAADPPPPVRVLYLILILAGLVALPVGVVGVLVLALRRLSRPGAEQAADYDDEGPRVDAEVYWDGRRVGTLRAVVVDQPYYHGRWYPAGDAGFEAALAVRGWLPVLFQAPADPAPVPARALASRLTEGGVYFRFGFWGDYPDQTVGLR